MRLIEKYDKIISKYSNIYPILKKVDLRLVHDCNGNCLIDSFKAIQVSDLSKLSANKVFEKILLHLNITT